jgi:hypothetical protein
MMSQLLQRANTFASKALEKVKEVSAELKGESQIAA